MCSDETILFSSSSIKRTNFYLSLDATILREARVSVAAITCLYSLLMHHLPVCLLIAALHSPKTMATRNDLVLTSSLPILHSPFQMQAVAALEITKPRHCFTLGLSLFCTSHEKGGRTSFSCPATFGESSNPLLSKLSMLHSSILRYSAFTGR